ncbi:MAG: XRE family transcriptional regulator [Pseudomonadota bacterium]
MIGWRVKDLAEASGVSVPTVQRMDSANGPAPGRNETVLAIRKALEAQGIQFLEDGQVAAGPGVAMKRSQLE